MTGCLHLRRQQQTNQPRHVITDVTYVFTYETENRLTSIVGGGVSATFLYDADGQRVKGAVNGVTTVYIAGVYEYQGGATTLYYEGNAIRRSGYATDNGVFYLLQDHLKSSSAFVTQAGVVNSRNYFFPFGGNRGGTAFSLLTTKRFTGQYHEAGLPGGEGLSYYGARWYDAKLGRFITPDSIVPGPANPQAFNRYSYVLNSPTNRIDPTGHFDVKLGDDPWWKNRTATIPRKSTSSPIEQQAKTRVFYLNGLGGHPLQPSAESLSEYDYLFYRLREAFGRSNVTHVPLFTNQYRRGWSHLEMFQEAAWPYKPWTDVATTTIATELASHPLEQGERLVLVGSSAGGTVAIEALSRLEKRGIHVDQVVLRGSLVQEFSLTNVTQVDYIAANPPWSDQWYSLDVNPLDGIDVQEHIAAQLHGHTPSGTLTQIQSQLQEIGRLIVDVINGGK